MKLHPRLTPEVILEAAQRYQTSLDNPGLCTACGNEQGWTEPDAEGYECEACGEEAVYGAEQLVIMTA